MNFAATPSEMFASKAKDLWQAAAHEATERAYCASGYAHALEDFPGQDQPMHPIHRQIKDAQKNAAYLHQKAYGLNLKAGLKHHAAAHLWHHRKHLELCD